MENINLTSFQKMFKNAFARGEILTPNSFGHDSLIHRWYQHVTEQQFLYELIEDETQEINFHRSNIIERVTSNRKSNLEISHLNLEWVDLELSFQVMCYQKGIQWNYKKPFASFGMTLKECSDFNLRITLLHPTLCPHHQWKSFIRILKNNTTELGNNDIILKGDHGKNWIQGKKNILIAGPTKSGKTTLLKNLARFVENQEHLVILEDTHELQLAHAKTTYFLAQDTQEGSIEEQLKLFCSHAMRISPDRIFLGEMRGPEVAPFLLLMNSGHRGLMSTIHANSAVDAIHRAALLFCLYQKGNNISFDQALKLVAKNIDLVCYLEDLKVKEVITINGCDRGQVFFETLINE